MLEYRISKPVNVAEIANAVEKNKRLRGATEWFKSQMAVGVPVDRMELEIRAGKLYDQYRHLLVERKTRLDHYLIGHPKVQGIFKDAADFFGVDVPENITAHLLLNQPKSPNFTGFHTRGSHGEIILPSNLGTTLEDSQTILPDLRTTAHESLHGLVDMMRTSQIPRRVVKYLGTKDLSREDLSVISHGVIFALCPGVLCSKYGLAVDDKLFSDAKTKPVPKRRTRDFVHTVPKILAERILGITQAQLDSGKNIFSGEYPIKVIDEYLGLC